MWWYGRGNNVGSWLPEEKKADMWHGKGNGGGSWPPAFSRSSWFLLTGLTLSAKIDENFSKHKLVRVVKSKPKALWHFKVDPVLKKQETVHKQTESLCTTLIFNSLFTFFYKYNICVQSCIFIYYSLGPKVWSFLSF